MARKGVGFALTGAAELEAALRELPAQLSKRILTDALTGTAEPIAADARSRAKGKIAENIGVSTQLSRRQRRERPRDKNEIVVFVGASKRGEAILKEFGTGPRYRASWKGGFTGQMPAEPFMRPAWEAGKSGALARLTEILRRKIEAAAVRLARKRKKAK